MKLLQGDCLDILKTLEDNSIDAIVTDPPYGLVSINKRWSGKEVKNTPGMETKEGSVWARKAKGFMGKEWDGSGIEYNTDMWRECYRVLKPGGYLLAFTGTRTYHKIASAIDDAGFEIRDMIAWVYGCLSEDTEILTESGYKPLHKLTQYDRIGVYDITNNIYKWERPQIWSVYKVHQDTAYRIKSDYTDQIVSRNHRCLVEREGKLVFIQAEELNEVEYMPTLSEDFYSLQKNSNRKLLLKELLWKGKGLAKKVFSKWTGNKKSEERIEVRKEPSLERWSNLLEETRKLQADKICEVSEGVFTDGEKRWICNGTSFDNGSILGDMFRENPSSASYQSRPTGQPTGKPDVISIKQGTQITRRARVTKIEYSGIIFCPTVSTGAFIARRNGQVFITGNSGFPKSLNIGKAVARLQGEYIPKTKGFNVAGQGIGLNPNRELRSDHPNYVKPTFDNEWEGWGTALKPALEPITVARKPLAEKTVAENCLKWGVGGINIDECRVEGLSEKELNWTPQRQHAEQKTYHKGVGGAGIGSEMEMFNKLGRFPANLIHDGSDEVVGLFPNTKTGAVKNTVDNGANQPINLGGGLTKERPADSGSAARFFYCAKASRSERNRGLDKLVQVDIMHILSNNTNICEKSSIKEVKLATLLVDMETSQLEGIEGSGTQNKSVLEWSIELFGKNLTEKYQEDFRSIILTETQSITPLKIYKWLIHLLTKEYTADVSLEMESGGNHVVNAENCNTLTITISEKMALALGVKNAQSPTQLKISVKEGRSGHPTVKPIALMEYLVKLVSREGHTILDPFAGSFTTGIACINLDRKFIGIERDPEYFKIGKARIDYVIKKKSSSLFSYDKTGKEE